jgi:hypothetical protein
MECGIGDCLFELLARYLPENGLTTGTVNTVYAGILSAPASTAPRSIP